jgi:phage gpG-like protein
VAIKGQAKGLVQTKRNMEKTVAGLHGPDFLKAMQEVTLTVANDAKRLAPVDTGRLRASITPEVRQVANFTQGVVGSNVVYAPYMELGTGTFVGRPRYFPPPSALDTWARRHGMSSGFAVAMAIWKRGGTRPRRFLQGAFDRNRKYIVQRIGQAVARIVNNP